MPCHAIPSHPSYTSLHFCCWFPCSRTVPQSQPSFPLFLAAWEVQERRLGLLLFKGKERAVAFWGEKKVNSYSSYPCLHLTDLTGPPHFRPARWNYKINFYPCILGFLGNLMPFVLMGTETWKEWMRLSRKSTVERDPKNKSSHTQAVNLSYQDFLLWSHIFYMLIQASFSFFSYFWVLSSVRMCFCFLWQCWSTEFHLQAYLGSKKVLQIFLQVFIQFISCMIWPSWNLPMVWRVAQAGIRNGAISQTAGILSSCPNVHERAIGCNRFVLVTCRMIVSTEG